MSLPPPLLQLLHIPGVGHTTLNRLLFRMREQGISLEDLSGFSFGELVYQLGFRAEWAESFFLNRDSALGMAEELARHSIQIIVNGDEAYPGRLNRILGDAAPAVLFLRGNPALLHPKSVGVVGARECSERGIAAAQRCVEQLAAHTINIVSGNAAGIDSVAHQTALATGGTTVFVLAQGILPFHPREAIRPLLLDENHLILSEFPPRLPWATHAAMQRNRTICALSHAVLLVESGIGGGTFATGKNALKQGIPLFSVDYESPPSSAEGNRYFLNRGARPIREKHPDLSVLMDTFTHPLDSLQDSTPSLFYDE